MQFQHRTPYSNPRPTPLSLLQGWGTPRNSADPLFYSAYWPVLDSAFVRPPYRPHWPEHKQKILSQNLRYLIDTSQPYPTYGPPHKSQSPRPPFELTTSFIRPRRLLVRTFTMDISGIDNKFMCIGTFPPEWPRARPRGPNPANPLLISPISTRNSQSLTL